MKDLSVLDQLIVGRVDPHIYAFTTNTIPNYLKVGDTYRPVAVRLQEWREHFPDLQKEYDHIAKVSDDVYFRDFAVHSFLELEKHRARLMPADLPEGRYYSKEFFKKPPFKTSLKRLAISSRITTHIQTSISFTVQRHICRKHTPMIVQKHIRLAQIKTKRYGNLKPQ